jgi:hypothetical protein
MTIKAKISPVLTGFTVQFRDHFAYYHSIVEVRKCLVELESKLELENMKSNLMLEELDTFKVARYDAIGRFSAYV